MLIREEFHNASFLVAQNKLRLISSDQLSLNDGWLTSRDLMRHSKIPEEG